MKLSRQSITSGTIVLVCTTLISNSLGIYREMLVAKSFGVGVMYDAYVVSLYLPSTIYAAFFYGMSNVFTPLYYQVKQKEGAEGAKTFTANFFGSWTVVTTVTIVLLILFTPLILKPFSSSSGEFYALIVQMTRILLFAFGIGCFYVILRSILSAEKHFLHPSLATIVYNIIIIVFMLTLGSIISVYAMVYGSIAGMFIQLVYLYIVFRSFKIPIVLSFGFKNKYVASSFKLAVPIMGLEALWGIFYLIDGYFASLNSAGSVSLLNYASTLFRFPGYLIGMSLSAAMLPSFSQAIQSNRIEDLRSQFSKAFRYVLTFSILFSGIFFLESYNIVSLIYQRGAFDSSSVERTSSILRILSFGFFFVIMYPVLTKVFNAIGNNMILLTSFFVGIVVKIGSYLLFYRHFGNEGIVFSMLTGYSIIFLIPFIVVNRTTNLIGRSEYLLIVKSAVLLVLNIALQEILSNVYSLIVFLCSFLFIYRNELLKFKTEIHSKIVNYSNG